MLPPEYAWIVDEFEPEGNLSVLREITVELEADGNLEGAATVLDRMFGLDPANAETAQRRRQVLDRLAVTEHGIRFRYIPGGSFLMGSHTSEPDERPFHPVWLAPYWMAETPVSWTAYCRLMNWEPPPWGAPRSQQGMEEREWYGIYHENRIRLQYCEDRTTHATDWHAHMPGQTWRSGSGQVQTSQELFGTPPRSDPDAPWQYDTKPMVAVSYPEAVALANRLSGPRVRYDLPTEAQWEKAARGGLIGARYPWGDEPPTPERCDFGRFHEFAIQTMKALPPNGYGLFAMTGGVWEWTRDWYCADYYGSAPPHDPEGPSHGKERVLRGGSWADDAEVVTVTFRMSSPLERGYHCSPNVGFRLCRFSK